MHAEPERRSSAQQRVTNVTTKVVGGEEEGEGEGWSYMRSLSPGGGGGSCSPGLCGAA